MFYTKSRAENPLTSDENIMLEWCDNWLNAAVGKRWVKGLYGHSLEMRVPRKPGKKSNKNKMLKEVPKPNITQFQ